jgi:hypothetical protein
MPYLARLTAELADMRHGRGNVWRRQELRQLLAAVDPTIRHQRNVEHVKLCGIRARLRNLDTRADPGALQQALALSARRLAALDLEIAETIARLRRRSP